MENERTNVPVGKYIVAGIVGLIVLVALFGSFTLIGAGKRGVVTQFGKVSDRIMNEGLNFKMPIRDSVTKLDVKIQKEEAEASAASKDLQTVTAKIALNYHLNPDYVNKLWQGVGSEYKIRIIDPAIQEAVKASTAKYTAEELITKRQSVKEEVKLLLLDRLVKEYIIVDELSIVNFSFSDSFDKAIEAKVTAEQNALAAKNKLEQSKYEADQRIAQARGEAEAIKIQAQAITSAGGQDYVSLQWIKQWDGKLPITSLGGTPTPLINIGK